LTTRTAEAKDQKDAASGYAGLTGATLVPAAELGTGTPDATKVLLGNQVWTLLTSIVAVLTGGKITKGQILKEYEADFTTSARARTFTVSDSDAAAGDKIVAFHSGNAATGRDASENEMDALIVRAVCLVNGTITFYVDSLFGPVFGKYRLHYFLG